MHMSVYQAGKIDTAFSVQRPIEGIGFVQLFQRVNFFYFSVCNRNAAAFLKFEILVQVVGMADQQVCMFFHKSKSPFRQAAGI